jgi:hypothetical protein
MVQGPILRYPFLNVGFINQSIMSNFHVRASSVKEKINMNEIMICYMLHGTNLWTWSDNGTNKIQKINKHPASNYVYLGDKVFLYMETEEIEMNGQSIQ